MIEPKINIADSYEDLCEKVTREILAFSNKKLDAQGIFTIVLSGGATPKGVYQCMASAAYKDRFQWEKIHFFWSDERGVPHEDKRSNYRMVSEALLTKVNIPSVNVHPIPTSGGTLEDSARLYEETITNFFKLKKGEFPHFDLVLLGIGQDGHTASIFPGNSALLVKDRLVIDVSPKEQAETRITLTLPAINHAQRILFVVSGYEKADIVHEVLENKKRDHFPADNIKPSEGELYWFLDMAAACKLVSVRIPGRPKRIGIAADHGGYQLKEKLHKKLCEASYEVIDFGNQKFDPDDDFPDFVIPLARAVARTEVDRGIAICGSGVGACIAANKVAGVRACMVHEKFSARQGVEDDDMNVICLGNKVLDEALAWELVRIFLSSQFSNAQRHHRRLAKVALLEK